MSYMSNLDIDEKVINFSSEFLKESKWKEEDMKLKKF